MLSDARRGEAYPVLREWASAKKIRYHWRCGLSSWLDLGERRPCPLAISLPLPIGRRLRLGTAHRVQDAQQRQGHEIIELVGDAPEEAPKRSVSHAAKSATRPGTSPRGDRTGPRERGVRPSGPRRLPRLLMTRQGSGLRSFERRHLSSSWNPSA